MKKLHVFLFTLYFSLAFSSTAQDAVFDWAYGLYKTSGYGIQSVESVVCDSLGNVYAFGNFSGTVQFDFNNQTHQATSAGVLDCFIVKLSPTKDFIWAKTFGGVGHDRISDSFIFEDESIYLTGSFHDTIDVDFGPNIYNIAAAGQFKDKTFIIKIDTTGSLIWANAFGSPNSLDNSAKLTVDDNENVFVGGGFKDTIDFNPGNGVYELISEGNYDAYVLKLNANGDFVHAKRFGSNQYDFINDISTDENGNIYTIGNFSDSVDFDPGAGTYFLTSNVGNLTNYGCFIQKLDNNGNFIFARSFAGNGASVQINALKVSGQDIYTTGNFTDTVDFDVSPNVYKLGSSGQKDLFIHKIDTSGNFQWVKTVGGTGMDEGISIEGDKNNNVYVSGVYSSTVDFDPGSSSHLIQSTSVRNQFILKLNSADDFEWVYALVGNGAQAPKNITLNNQDEIVIGGSLSNSADFNNGSGTAYINGGGAYSNSSFIFKLKQCYVSNSTQTVQACNSFTWINGNTYFNSTSTPVYTLNSIDGCDSIVSLDLTIINESSGTETVTACDSFTWSDGITYTSSNNTAKDTLMNSVGCDSIVTLNLTINNSHNVSDSVVACDSYTWIDGNTYYSSNNSAKHVLNSVEGCDSIVTLNLVINSVSDLSITSFDSILVANNSGVNYQWLDCDNNMLPIWGATEDTLIAPTDGNYAVVIQESGCVDTSNCINMNFLNLEEPYFNEFNYYPNPTKNKVNIKVNNTAELSIFDLTGRAINNSQHIYKTQVIDLSKYTPGIYIFQLKFKNEVAKFNVVLQ